VSVGLDLFEAARGTTLGGVSDSPGDEFVEHCYECVLGTYLGPLTP
jgi:hypothetical protein